MTYTRQVLIPLFQKLNESDVEFSSDICFIIEDLNNLMKQILNDVQIEYNSYPENNVLTQKYFTILELKNASDDFMDVINKRTPVEYLMMSIRPTLEAALKIASERPFDFHLKTKFIQDRSVKGYYSQTSSCLHANYIINKTNFYYSCLNTCDFKKVDLHLTIYIDTLLIILGKYNLLPLDINFQTMYNHIYNYYNFNYSIKPK